MPVFTGSLKDEPIKQKKIDSKKTRVFCGAPVDWSIVVRKYLLAFTRVFQLQRFAFEDAVGIVAQSSEWEDLYHYLTKFGGKRMIAGDYAAFDKRMPAQFILAAFEIISHVCKRSGNYSSDDLRVIRGIAMDTAFPLVDFNGDLIELFGSNPSGHPLTVVINCIVNSLYMRYVYSELNPNKDEGASTFKQNVALVTYGDDNAMGCSENVPWFNHTAISLCLARVGIQYTMADKEAESVPYLDMSQISFLKRTWRFDSDIGAFVCPLDESSMAKSLTMWIPSKTVSSQAQAIDVLSSVVREYFWYGKEIFQIKSDMCKDIVRQLDLQLWVCESTFPSWDDLLEAYQHASMHA